MRGKHFWVRQYQSRVCALVFLILTFYSGVGTVQAFSSDLFNMLRPTGTIAPNNVSENGGGSFEEMLAMAKKLAAEGKYADAIAGVNDAIERNPGDAVLYFERGSLYYYLMLSEMPDTVNAEMSSPAWETDLQPGSAESLGNERRTVFVDRCDRALADLNQAIALKTNYAVFYYMRGMLFSSNFCAQRNLWKAIADYDRALGIDTANAVYHLERGRAWAKLSHYREAVSNIDRAIRLEPGNYYLYYEKGLIREKEQWFPEAAESYKAALELAPPDRLTLFSQALSRARKGNCRDLIADYTELIVRRPAMSVFYINRALCYGDQKKYAKAVGDISTALNLQNDRRDLYFTRGKLLYDKGNRMDALKDFETSCKEALPAACYYRNALRREMARGERWVPFWYSRNNRKYFYDRQHLKTQGGSFKVARVRIEADDSGEENPAGTDNTVSGKERGDYTLEKWEFNCPGAQIRISMEKRLDRDGQIIAPQPALEKAFRPVSPGGFSDKLYQIVCRQGENKGTPKRRVILE
jgi:tetratricopeptide (TPR) repeat protein